MALHKRHFALQGLTAITLVIPVLFAYYLHQTGSFVQESFLYGPTDVMKLRPVYYVKPDRPFKIYHVNGNHLHDKKIMHNFFLSSQKMMKDGDTTCGVKIILDKGVTYKSFIDVLTVFCETRVELYSFEGNSLWAIDVSAGEEKKTREIFEKEFGVYVPSPK